MCTRYFALPWLCLAASPVLACGTCGCLLNSDWASQGFTSRAGYHLDLPSAQEIQRRSLTRLTTLGACPCIRGPRDKSRLDAPQGSSRRAMRAHRSSELTQRGASRALSLRALAARVAMLRQARIT